MKPRAANSREAQEIHEQAMRRLRVCIAVLSAVVLASVARAVADGLNPTRGFALVLTIVLLVASLWLWRQGTRLTPGRRREPHRG